MRRTTRLLFTAILLATILSAPLVALATSDITSATYSGVILVTNNSTANSSVATVMTLSSADMISQGWIDSAFTRLAVRNDAGADVVFGPSVNSTYPWSLWVPTINANSSLSYVLYTGPSDMSSIKSYFPGLGGMTVPDSATIEPSANFSHTINGNFVNTGIFWRKPGSMNYYYDLATTNVTAYLNLAFDNEQTSQNASQSLYATTNYRTGARITAMPAVTLKHAGFYLQKVGAPSGTANITLRAVAADALIGTFGTINVANLSTEYKWYDFFTPVTNGSTQDVRVLVEYNSGDASNYINVGVASGGTLANSQNSIYSGAYTDQPTIDTTYQLYAALSSVTGTGVTAGEHTIAVSENSTLLWVSKDGATAGSTASVVTVSNNSSNWNIGQNNVLPYINSVNMTVGGNQRGSWVWEYAATFTDGSGNGNTATPTFRTASSDADISANLTSFAPITLARAPPYTVTTAPSFVSTANITTSGNFTSGNVTASNLPGSDLIDASAQAAGVPNIWLWGIFGGLLVAVLGLVISWFERTYGSGNGTLLARFAVAAIVIGILITLSRFDWWMLFMFFAIGLAPVLASRQYDVGASPGELNMVGFLAMTWMGLTMINSFMAASLITSGMTNMINQWMFTQDFKLLGLFTVPIVNFEFFSEGVPALLKWDNSMFYGNAQMIQYLLYSITAVAGFIVFMVTTGLVTSYFTRRTP